MDNNSSNVTNKALPAISKRTIQIGVVGGLITIILLIVLAYSMMRGSSADSLFNRSTALDPLSATSLNLARSTYQDKLLASGPFWTGGNKPTVLLQSNGLLLYKNPKLNNLNLSLPAFIPVANGIQPDGSEIMSDVQLPTVLFETKEASSTNINMYTITFGTGFAMKYFEDGVTVQEKSVAEITADSRSAQLSIISITDKSDPSAVLNSVYTGCGTPAVEQDTVESSRELWTFPSATKSCLLQGRVAWHFSKSFVIAYPQKDGCVIKSSAAISSDPAVDPCRDRAIINSIKELQ
jgi:hypothetical protein